MVTAWLSRLQYGLLPPTCVLCGANGAQTRDLCVGCAADLPHNREACPRCAVPLPVGYTGICESCCTHPPLFDCAFAPFCYQPPIDSLLKDFKFGGRLAQGRLLGELFAAALAERNDPLPDCIVPVPLHPQRLRERGFNQALELVRTTAHRFNIPLLIHGLRRVRYTAPQTRLDARCRQTNPLGAFVLGDPLPGMRVALMDDVITTTSTIAECARILRSGGATIIEAWAVGRAVIEPSAEH